MLYLRCKKSSRRARAALKNCDIPFWIYIPILEMWIFLSKCPAISVYSKCLPLFQDLGFLKFEVSFSHVWNELKFVDIMVTRDIKYQNDPAKPEFMVIFKDTCSSPPVSRKITLPCRAATFSEKTPLAICNGIMLMTFVWQKMISFWQSMELVCTVVYYSSSPSIGTYTGLETNAHQKNCYT